MQQESIQCKWPRKLACLIWRQVQAIVQIPKPEAMVKPQWHHNLQWKSSCFDITPDGKRFELHTHVFEYRCWDLEQVKSRLDEAHTLWKWLVHFYFFNSPKQRGPARPRLCDDVQIGMANWPCLLDNLSAVIVALLSSTPQSFGEVETLKILSQVSKTFTLSLGHVGSQMAAYKA